MKLAFIHISDIHFRDDESMNFLNSKVKSITSSINANIEAEEKMFILITGDSSFSGKKEEFDIALQFYISLVEKLENKNTEFIIIPGNHDCNFSRPSKIRDMLKNKLTPDEIEEEIIDQITLPLSNYYDFASLFREEENLFYSDKLFEQYRYNISDWTIQINCINTAWYSEKNEESGDLLYPIQMYKEYMQNPASLSITLLHHPTHWLAPNNKREVDIVLKECSDIVLTGHEHTSTANRGNDFTGLETIYLEGAALQTNEKNESSFNIIHLDLVQETISQNNFNWVNEESLYKKESIIIHEDIPLFKTQKKNGLNFTEDYQNWLQDPGIMIKHPRVLQNILLEDLYVFPDVEIVNHSKHTSVTEDDVRSIETLLSFEIQKIMLIGSENYGKTAFCKIYIKKALSKDYIPIKIDGRRLNKTSINDIRKVLKAEFITQYGEDKVSIFDQLDKSKVILIVDDLYNSPLNSNHRLKLLNTINDNFKNVLITSRELIKYEELIVKGEEANYKNDFNFYEMLALGHACRGDLINKWNNLGDQSTIENAEKIKKIDKCESIIKTVLGNNYVPSLPFFILTLLQTIESGDSNLKDSAYGFYYEYLIRNQLLNVKLSNEDLNTFNNYIAFLAYYTFKEKKTDFSKADLEDFHEQYTEDFAVDVEFSVYLKLLSDASIIVSSGTLFSFKFKYVYYYYVAKYLADNMDNQEISDLVSEISGKLYNEEYSNIIMFLSHLSKNPIILSNVLESAKKIFSEIIPSELSTEIRPLNALVVNIPELVIENRDVLKERKERQVKADEYERMTTTNSVEDSSDSSLDESTFDIVSNLNWAMKTIEIMGQILKNYYGSTKKDTKIVIGEEVYKLSLRSLNAFLTSFMENTDNILLDLERIIKKESLTNDNKIQAVARNFIFGLTSAISVFFIQKVSSSVGTTDLQPIFDELNQLMPTTAVKLIDISIKLDHAYEIPFSEIEQLLNQVGDNPMVNFILRRVVVNHLYMFPVNYRDRQRVIKLLSLNPKKLSISTLRKNLLEQ